MPISEEPAGVPSARGDDRALGGAVQARQPRHPPDGERVDQAEDDGGGEQHAQRGAALAEQKADHLIRFPG